MKSFTVIASCLLLCSCADMVVTKTYVSSSSAGMAVDAKDIGSVHYQANCGVGAAHPSAIYIRPFCIDSAVFYDDEAASDAEMPIRQALVPHAFAADLKEELSKLAPAIVIAEDEVPKVGWLVEGRIDHVDSNVSYLSMHVRVTDVVQHRVVYEFDLAGGNHGQGFVGSVRAGGLHYATPFDLRNAAERIFQVLSPDPYRFGARSSLTLR